MARIIMLLSALLFATVAWAADDFVKVRTLNALDIQDPTTLAASLTNLSPQAIEAGLRDAEILASGSMGDGRVLEIEWHSISKEIKGTKLSEAFLEPLKTKVKLDENVSAINAGQKLVASGEPQEIIDAYNRLLKKAEENMEINNKELNTENSTNEYSNDGGAGAGGGDGGYFSGDGQDLQENTETDDFELNTDQIVSSVEQCPMFVDLDAMSVNKQERTVKTSTNTGEIVEVTDCKTIGQTYPIRKDFNASCSTKVDSATGNYIKGHKLYAYVDGSRFNISECEWDQADAREYQVKKDFDMCSLDKAVIEVDSGVYQPAYVEYAMIDGQRRNLSECETNKNETRALPVAYERCELLNDFNEMVSYEQSRKVFKSPDEKETVKTFDCANTGKQFDIQKDFDVAQCTNLPNYADGKMLLGYKMFVNYAGAKKFVSDCMTDPEEFLPMAQDIAQCEASVNLTSNEATIMKKWFVETKNGGKEYVTDCVETETTFPIVESDAMCTPKVIDNGLKVVLQSQKVWYDDKGVTHTATECRPTADELAIKKEMCTSPQFDHDFAAGQSYYRSRDYYEKDGEKTYINQCSRDPVQSFTHITTTTGCSAAHDDANKRSQVYSKVDIEVNGQRQTIRQCAADTGFMPYTRLSVNTGNFFTKTGGGGSYPASYGFQAFLKALQSKSYMNKVNGVILDTYPYGPNSPDEYSQYYNTGLVSPFSYKVNYRSTGKFYGETYATIHYSQEKWRRYDGSIYYTPVQYTVDIKQSHQL